jgi:hypothetical protein
MAGLSGAVALCAAPDTMRSFFRSRWKVILAIVLLVVLALVTVNPRAAPRVSPHASLPLRLLAHAAALEAAGLHADPTARRLEAADYIAGVLRMEGYRVRRASAFDGGGIEATIGNVAPGAAALRTFMIGARIDPAWFGRGADGDGNGDGGSAIGHGRDDAADAASVLELARLLKDARPGRGNTIRFVFFLAARPALAPDEPGGGSFIAFAGTPTSAHGVRDALAAFQGAAPGAGRGLAAPAYLQGVTLSDGGAGPALMITDTQFTSYPYRQVGAPCARKPCDRTLDARRDYDGMARVVAGIARTIAALSAGQRG